MMIRVKEGDEETLLTIEEFERRARRGEISPNVWVCLPAMTGDGFVHARDLPLFTAIYDPRRFHFRRHFHIGRAPLVTSIFIALCIALYIWVQRLGAGEVNVDVLLMLGAKSAARIIEDGELWRLLAANFLHRNAVHVAFNLFAFMCIGAVLEGVYRRGDLILLLTVCGLSTMGLSVLLTEPVTVGASGLVFGCLGCAVVFGWRYSEILAWRYRFMFGVVLVGYAAVMFYLGLKSPTTDNWGHAGGLLAGALMGGVLQPRLMRLHNTREARHLALRPYFITASIIVALFVVGPFLPRLLLGFAPYNVSAFGVQLERPAHWKKSGQPFGLTFQNGADAFASLSCSRRAEAGTLNDAVVRYQNRALFLLAEQGRIGDLRVGALRDEVIGSPELVAARSMSFSYLASDGPRLAEATLWVRGTIECALVLAHRPRVSDTALGLLHRIKGSVRLSETAAQAQGRAAVRARPDAQSYLELALAHQAAGAMDDAGAAMAEALARTDGDIESTRLVMFAAARLALVRGDENDVALGYAERAHALRSDVESALLATSAALISGDEYKARRYTDDAERIAPDDKRVHALRRRVDELSP